MLHAADSFLAEHWPPDSVRCLSDAYPMVPAVFEHRLCGHPLLDRSALAAAAWHLPAKSVELRRADPDGGFVPIAVTPESLGAMFAGGMKERAWLMLRGLETLPPYRDLFDAVLAPVASLSAARTGRLHQPRGFLFCANAGSGTPLHFDHEHNLLCHLEGPKRVGVLPDRAPWLEPHDHVRFAATGDNVVAPRDTGGAALYDLAPGTALHIPYRWPHWVEVGDAPSLSLSITWRSDWSLARNAAWRGTALLGRLGVRHRPMPDWPGTTPVRSMLGRIAGRLA